MTSYRDLDPVRLLRSLIHLVLLASCALAPRPEADTQQPEDSLAPHVLLISFDGMRYDFIDRVTTPAFDRLARAGVRATGLIPVYPTRTFPNHYTLATGLYPDRHGLVDNVFYDPVFDADFAPGDATAVRDARWYGGEPIWVTAERQGARAAAFFWVGTEAPIGGRHPSDFRYYDARVPDHARVDTVLAWLARPAADRPRLVLIYFGTVDATAHRTGPDHPDVDHAILAMDALLGRLLDGIDALPVRSAMHVVVVSDHGMIEAPAGNVVRLGDLVDLEGVRVVYNPTQAMLHFEGDEQRMWSVFEALQDRLDHATVYLADELPARWRYGRNRRVGELVVVTEPGWVLASPRARSWAGGGMHGWDPYLRPMQGIFLAAGPRIRPGSRIAAFEAVHVHAFLARLLGVRPAPDIDGRAGILDPVLNVSLPN